MSRQKAKGTAFETLIANYLTDKTDQLVERRPLNGARDDGDLHVFGPRGLIVIEAKNHQRMELADWVDQANAESANADIRRRSVAGAVVVHKRRGKGRAEEQYVTLDMRTFTYLIWGTW